MKMVCGQMFQPRRDMLIGHPDRTLEIPTVTEVKGDDGHVSVRPAANDAYKVSIKFDSYASTNEYRCSMILSCS